MEALTIGFLEDFYDLGHLLGKGGFGKVILGMDKESGEEVAIKLIPRNKCDDSVVSECKLLRRLGRHENITEYHGVYLTRDRYYFAIVMELLPYGELLDVLAHAMASNYGEPQVAIIFRQVASAVDHCHRNGVVHADLKLENIFCLSANVKTVEALKNATLKLGDFGAAIELEEGKFATGGVGTFNYMPPERLLQQGFTEKADVWGLGVLLYALIAGRLPFPGQDRQTVLHWVKQGPDMSLDEFAAVSPLAVELIRKMLHPDPNQRPSVAHVLENKWMMGNVQQTAVLGKTLTSLRRQNMARKFRAATRLLMAGGRVVRIARAMKAEELMMDMAGYDIHPQDILSLSAAFFAATGGGLYVEKKVFGQVMATVLQMHDYELVDAVYDAYWECERHQAAISDLSDTVRNNASILIQRRRTLSYLGKSGMHTQSDGNLVKNRRNDNSDEVITNDATDSVYPDSQSLGSDVLVVEEDWEVPLGEGRDATLVAQHVGPPRQGICLDCAEGDRHCTTHTQTHGTMEMAEVSTQTAPGKLADALCSCVDKAACVCKEVEKVTKQACAKGKSKGLAMGATMTMPEPKRFEAFDSGDVAAPRQQNDPTEPSGATKKEKPVIGMCNTTDAQKGFANRNLTHIVTKMLGAGGSHETHRPPEAMHTPPEVRVNRMSAPNSKRVGVDEPGPSNLGYGDGRHGNCTGSAEMEGAVAGADAQTRRLTPLPEKDNDDTNKGTASRKTSGMGPLKSIRPSAMSRPSDATVQQRRQTLMHDQVKCINHLNFLLSISGKLDLPVPVMAQLCFDLVDRDHTLFIDKREFRVFIESVLMIVVAGDVVDFDVVVDREFETCDKSGDGLISVSEFVSASSRSTLLKRYQDALARMWLTRNELFNSELETLHQSAQGWVSLNFGAQGGGGLMMTTGPWNKRYIALHDRRYLSVWKKYEDFASGVLGDRVYELSPEHVAMTMFIPVVLPNYGDYKVQAGRIKTRPRIKLAFSDGDCLILQAKSQRVMNMWEDLLIETGISHWRKQTVI